MDKSSRKEQKQDETKRSRRKEYSFWTATVFIIGDVAGGGLLSLPHATAQAGWSGLAMIVYCAFCAAYSGICLAECWIILEERYPQYRGCLTRKPFATIGLHAYGPKMSRIGSTTVFLLLNCNLLISLTKDFIHLTICQWIPIVAAVLMVPMWLGSPGHFWPIGYTAMLSTFIGTILLLVDLVIVIANNGLSPDFHVESFVDYTAAFGTILYAYSGAVVFPTIQNDMKRKDKFPKSVIAGFTTLTFWYLPVAGLGYAAFGFATAQNITDALSTGWLITVVRAMFLVHCMSAIFIASNPVFLDLEELFNIPKRFNWKRCLLRTCLMLLVVLICETFPSFGQIQNLIGSVSTALLSFVLACIFYIKLCLDSKNNPNWPQRQISKYTIIISAIVIATGTIGGIISAYSTLRKWTPIGSACYLSHSKANATHA